MLSTQTLIKLALLTLSNLIGFFSVFICYTIGIKTGAIALESPDFDAEKLRVWFFGGTMMVWVACALLSPAYFLIENFVRFFFLIAPMLIPLIYGLSILYGSFL